MSESGTASPSQPGGWWGGLMFPLSLLAAVANSLVLFFVANWTSVPEHRATPPGQAPATVETAAMGALPLWGLLLVVVVAAVACFIAELRDRPRIAMRLAAVQLLPVGLLIIGMIASAFLV